MDDCAKKRRASANDAARVEGMTTILLLDDHKIVGQGTKSMIESHSDYRVTYVSSGEEALLQCRQQLFDLYLLDMNLAEKASGFDIAGTIKEKDPEAKIIIYTGFDYKHRIEFILSSGIAAIVTKDGSVEDLMLAIQTVLSGYAMIPLPAMKKICLKEARTAGSAEKAFPAFELTDKEIRLLTGVAEGLTNAQLGELFFSSERTIAYWLTSLFKKLNVTSRSEAVSEAVRYKLIHL